MAGQKFQYDESGGTFYYFILSFLALLLIPSTFYFWPKKKILGEYGEVTVNNSFAISRRVLVSIGSSRYFSLQIRTGAKTIASATAAAASGRSLPTQTLTKM